MSVFLFGDFQPHTLLFVIHIWYKSKADSLDLPFVGLKTFTVKVKAPEPQRLLNFQYNLMELFYLGYFTLFR